MSRHKERRVFVFLRRRRGLSRNRFSRHWSCRHGPLVASNPEFWTYTQRYVQNHLLDAPAAFCDGIAVSTQRDPAYRGPGFPSEPCYLEVVRPDERKFLDFSAIARRTGEGKLLRRGRAVGSKIIVLGPRDLATRLERMRMRSAGRIVVTRLDPAIGRTPAVVNFAAVAEIWTPHAARTVKALRRKLPPRSLISEVREFDIRQP